LQFILKNCDVEIKEQFIIFFVHITQQKGRFKKTAHMKNGRLNCVSLKTYICSLRKLAMLNKLLKNNTFSFLARY